MTWARVGTGGVDGASRLSSAESEWVGRAERSRLWAWRVVSGRGPHIGRQGASRSNILMIYHINYNYYANIEKNYN
jgi:hypothetical protein